MLIGGIAVLSAIVAALLCVGTEAFASAQWLWLLPVSFIGSFLIWTLLAFLFVLLLCAFVDPDKQYENDSKLYRTVVNLIVGAIIPFARIRVETKGLEKTPKEGRFLLVCNHLHDGDPVVLLRHFKKSQLAFVGKREVKDMFIVGKLMPKFLCPFINRENDREALKTILRCVQLLKDDKVSVAIFPEGYIHKDRKFHQFRPGVFKIAQKAKVPIVVCTLKNTQNMVKNFLKLKPTDVKLHLLDVIPAESLQGRTTVEIAHEIHEMMAQDLGPEYQPEEQEDNT